MILGSFWRYKSPGLSDLQIGDVYHEKINLAHAAIINFPRSAQPRNAQKKISIRPTAPIRPCSPIAWVSIDFETDAGLQEIGQLLPHLRKIPKLPCTTPLSEGLTPHYPRSIRNRRSNALRMVPFWCDFLIFAIGFRGLFFFFLPHLCMLAFEAQREWEVELFCVNRVINPFRPYGGNHLRFLSFSSAVVDRTRHARINFELQAIAFGGQRIRLNKWSILRVPSNNFASISGIVLSLMHFVFLLMVIMGGKWWAGLGFLLWCFRFSFPTANDSGKKYEARDLRKPFWNSPGKDSPKGAVIRLPLAVYRINSWSHKSSKLPS